MQSQLAKKLRNKITLKILRDNLLNQMMEFSYHNEQNIYFLLCQHDATIGEVTANRIRLYEGSWVKIVNLVISVTGVDIVSDNIEHFDGYVTRTLTSPIMDTPDEKILNALPTQGYVMCRLLGRPDVLPISTQNFVNQPTPLQTYLGVNVQQLAGWQLDTLIVIDSFAAFTEFGYYHLKKIGNLNPNETVLLIYKGHDYNNIFGVASQLAQLACQKYVFTDYDLAGLKLAEIISGSIQADGYVLPRHAWINPNLQQYNRLLNLEVQPDVTLYDDALAPYQNDIKLRFLSVSQEALLANGVGMKVIEREDVSA